jgi:hypothetical protein
VQYGVRRRILTAALTSYLLRTLRTTSPHWLTPDPGAWWRSTAADCSSCLPWQTRQQVIYQHVLGQAWPFPDMVKAPVVKSLPDVLSVEEIARIVVGTRERRYQTPGLPRQTNQ